MARDPRYPRRPDHPDFDRLSAVCRAVDEAAEQPGFDFMDWLARFLDVDSLLYVAEQRALRVQQRATEVTPSSVALQVAWIDGFTMARELGLAGPAPRDGQHRPR